MSRAGAIELRLTCRALLLACSVAGLQPCAAADATGPVQRSAVLLSTDSAMLRVPVRSWKALRDGRVVKQDLDMSCGAASLATLLHLYGREDVTEQALLEAMDKGELRASFEDMAQVLPRFGFKAQGFAASWEQLTRLRAPVVVYLRHRKDDHFSVLRGIGRHTVWLADPSLGNRSYSRAQFMAMWQTRADKGRPELAGKFLAVIPAGQEDGLNSAPFDRAPRRSSTIALEQLAFRAAH